MDVTNLLETAPMQKSPEDEMVNLDPIWTSSRTARQIYVLGEVEKVCRKTHTEFKPHLHRHTQNISRLLSLAASTMSLMTLPQTDAPDAGLPKGDERSEQFVDEVNEYFQTLDVSLSIARCIHKPTRLFDVLCAQEHPS
jgi:hypothetical protein